MAEWQNRIIGEGDENPEQLLANPENWRIHPKLQQDVLSDVLDEVGWVQRVIVNRTTGHMVDGHLRAQLAISRGEPSIPVTYVELTVDEERKILATLDPLAAMAGTDEEKRQELLAQISAEGEALSAWLGGMIEPPSLQGDPDDVPDVPAKPVTKLGNLWLLGNHRLLCGDSLAPTDAKRLMGGSLADCIWTDPPYNVAYVGGTKDALTIENDDMSDQAFEVFLAKAFQRMFESAQPGAAIYVAHSDTGGGVFRRQLVEAGFLLKQCLIWVKDTFVLSRQDYHWQHEPILYGWKAGAAHSWYGPRTRVTVLDDGTDITTLNKSELVQILQEIADGSSVIREDKPQRSLEHPTMKPVRLIERMLENSTKRGDIVLDPFGGSGSTLIASTEMDRICYSMEVDPAYCDVIVARWERLTGKNAKRSRS